MQYSCNQIKECTQNWQANEKANLSMIILSWLQFLIRLPNGAWFSRCSIPIIYVCHIQSASIPLYWFPDRGPTNTTQYRTVCLKLVLVRKSKSTSIFIPRNLFCCKLKKGVHLSLTNNLVLAVAKTIIKPTARSDRKLNYATSLYVTIYTTQW